MAILVIAEHDNLNLKASTLNTVAAARAIGGEVDVLVAGLDCQDVARAAAAVEGVARVRVADAAIYAHGLAENLAALAVSLAAGYSHILAPATTFGKNFLPRVAALLDVAQISDVVAVEAADTFVHPIYAGNVMATVQSSDPVKVISVRTTAFDAPSGTGAAILEPVAAGGDSGVSEFVSEALIKLDRPELANARVIVSGGRALGSAEQFHAVLDPLADRLGAAIGATRAAVDAGYAPNDYQVGQTGKVVAPELYLALGISGAIQHVAGMKDSKVIVAINKDEDAPIFQVADYGIVGDLFTIVPELMAELGQA
ncbi:electron transfer flavoprotein subunit alpha/FixB family protein [Paludibacterium yongneupense]|uniref:electron transfer flavoprotein subunit alpha/FixB family protein n=1 Tax=Paludibacterium yongneupense TaxID=400061 RepID=UPI0003F9ACB9|nr:FAD-binding protein [Paludibacterium yongneupense]